MTTEDILKLQPGPALDQAVHAAVFGGIGKSSKFSTSDAAAITLLDRLPLFVASVDQRHPQFDPARPFAAGTLKPEPSVKGDVTLMRLTAATRAIALCKVALLIAHRHAPAQGLGQVSSEDRARALAKNVGRPKSPRPQPQTRIHAKDVRPPIPRRPKEFIPPEPQKS